MEVKQLFSLVVIGVLALIVLGSLIDTAAYKTSAGQTTNVTGVPRTVLDLLLTIFLIIVLLAFIGMI